MHPTLIPDGASEEAIANMGAAADWYVDLAYGQPWGPGVTVRLVDDRGPHPSHEACEARLREIMDEFADAAAMLTLDTGLWVERARCFQARKTGR
jgi:hypothetical protein